MYLGNQWPNQEQTWLLQACLFSGIRALQAWEKWRKSVDFDTVDAASYKLLPLLSCNLALESLKDPIFEKCKGIHRYVWVENHKRWKMMFPLLEGLTRAGVDKVVVLKGMAMILTYYRDFGQRCMGDIDILVQRIHLPIVKECLIMQGWKMPIVGFDTENAEHLKRWHALNFTNPSKMNLDVHWSFIQENSAALDDAVLQDAQLLAQGPLYLPGPTELLLQTCIHGAKYSPVPLIRWIPDAIMIFKHAETTIDWPRLIHFAEKSRICRPLHLALQYLAEKFEVPVPQSVLQHLKSLPSHWIEQREYRFNVCGYGHLAAWCRYCLNQGHLTPLSQILRIPKYLQILARLKSPWYVLPYGMYWIFTRSWRALMRALRCREARDQSLL